MAIEFLTIKHQPYIKFLPSKEPIKEQDKNKEGELIGIDTDMTMQQLLDTLVEKLDGHPLVEKLDGHPDKLGKDDLILLDHNL